MNSSDAVAVVIISGGSSEVRSDVAMSFANCMMEYVFEANTRHGKGRVVVILRKSRNGEKVRKITKEVLEKRRSEVPRGIRIVCQVNKEPDKEPMTRRRTVKYRNQSRRR